MPATATVNEDTAFAFTGANLISVADAQNNLTQVVLTVANGTLSAAGPGTVVGSGTASVTITGTQANINASLATLAYQGILNYNGADTLTVVSSDSGGASDTDNVAITVNPVNDGPANTVPGAQSTNEDTALVFSAGNGNLVAVADVDAGTIQVQLTVTNGVLTLASTTGLSFVGGGNGTATMTIQGSVADVNTAMNGMSYAPTGNYHGPAQLTVATSDLGNTGAGGVLTDNDTVAITVTPVDDVDPVAGNDAFVTNEDVALATTVAGNDTAGVDAPGVLGARDQRRQRQRGDGCQRQLHLYPEPELQRRATASPTASPTPTASS